MDDSEIDTDKIDDAVLALMYLGLHGERHSELLRSWKSFDWDATDRLHAKGYIFDPANKAKSVILTEEGLERCKQLFRELFSKRP